MAKQNNFIFGTAIQPLAIAGTASGDLLVGTSGNDAINGLDGNDSLIGLDGNDTLDGGTGADFMIGGMGDDVYYMDNVGDLVWENPGEGQDSVKSSISYALPDNVENLELSGMAITATGNGLNNTLTGDAQDNFIIGGGGSDKMLGGVGSDTYIVDGNDAVTELSGQGTDTVITYSIYTLGDNIENLILAQGQTGTGNGLDNTLTGNYQDNNLDGKGGADSLYGGLGNDTYTVDDPHDVVVEKANEGYDIINAYTSYTLPNNVEALKLQGGNVNLNGTGNALDNSLTGNAGLNILAGGLGNDTYYLGDSSHKDVAKENPNEGIDTVVLATNVYGKAYVLPDNIENLVLSGTNPGIIGNTLNNQLIGNNSNNILDGGIGNDFMIGGAGNDTYIVDSPSDIVIEKVGGGGTDEIKTSASYSLVAAPNIEKITLTGSANINATGNDLANVIASNGGSNVLTGNGGNDNFLFNTALGNSDTIADFTGGADRLSLAKAVFTGLGTKAGQFTANDVRFYAAAGATAAHDADDRVIYDTNTGTLYYDADGNGGGTTVQVAVLTGQPALVATDIWVV